MWNSLDLHRSDEESTELLLRMPHLVSPIINLHLAQLMNPC